MRGVLIGQALLLSATLAGQAPIPAPPAPPDARPSFAEWLDGVRAEAVLRGIREEVVDSALSGITEPLPIVIERDRAQAETVLPLETYIRTRVSTRLVRRGRDAYGRYRTTLDKISTQYGVPARIIAGIWGMESNFGGFSGVRPTINALATLAWDPRRSTFFRNELMSALEILNKGDIDLGHLRGSWAGAMGQPQFMPSSYLKYAEDFDGDGRRDIWNSPADVLASIANYLKGYGWETGKVWGREVKVSKATAAKVSGTVARRTGGCQATRDMSVALPLNEWKRLGVQALNGSALPPSTEPASLVSGTTRHFLVYKNYDALLGYNCANAYALSVVILGERVSRPPTPAGGR